MIRPHSGVTYYIRNKITNKWADLKNQPDTVQEAFDLAIKTETQIQVADSFKMEFTNNFTLADIKKLVLVIPLVMNSR